MEYTYFTLQTRKFKVKYDQFSFITYKYAESLFILPHYWLINLIQPTDEYWRSYISSSNYIVQGPFPVFLPLLKICILKSQEKMLASLPFSHNFGASNTFLLFNIFFNSMRTSYNKFSYNLHSQSFPLFLPDPHPNLPISWSLFKILSIIHMFHFVPVNTIIVGPSADAWLTWRGHTPCSL